MANLLSAASSVSKHILNLIPEEKDWSRLFKNLLKGIVNSDELALQGKKLYTTPTCSVSSKGKLFSIKCIMLCAKILSFDDNGSQVTQPATDSISNWVVHSQVMDEKYNGLGEQEVLLW